MPSPGLRAVQKSAGALAGIASAIIPSLSIAICAAAPEFIWQGLRIAIAHLSRASVISALLIGVILAFFVEPLTDRIRQVLFRVRHLEPDSTLHRNPLFTAFVSLSFALVSFSVHDAMLALLSGSLGDHGSGGLESALRLTLEWAIVPFFITLAWIRRDFRWAGLILGIVAASSSLLAAYLFDWTWITLLTTSVPCLTILFLGYVVEGRSQRGRFGRCARIVAWTAAAWLAFALLFDWAWPRYVGGEFQLYIPEDFWGDFRFYLGWWLGLVLAAGAGHLPREPRQAT